MAIDQNEIRYKGNAPHYKVYPDRVKAHSVYHKLKKNPLHTVIGFTHIKFESYKMLILFRPKVKRVESFVSYKNIIYN